MYQTANIWSMWQFLNKTFFWVLVFGCLIVKINIDKMYVYFQGVFYAIVIYGLTVLRVCYGPLPVFLCNIAGFLKICCNLFGAITITIYTFTRFMFVCIWKRMRQMNDNLIVGITTVQAIFMSLLFSAATWIQIQRQPTPPVSFFSTILPRPAF